VTPEFTDVDSLLATLAVHGAPCTAVTFVNGTVPGGINPYADCTGVTAGDTAVSMFTSHASARAYARRQIATSAGLGIAEVVGPSWTVNTVPVYARMVARAVGGHVISKAAAAPMSQPEPKPKPAQKPVAIAAYRNSGRGVEA
jgi:hypothetical protein